MGTLYIVATPIGNLQDITIRAMETLFSVDLIYAEEPSKTSVFLTEIKNRYGTGELFETKPKIISLNEYEEQNKIPEVINNLIEGRTIALVSEAGTPLLSDPGFKLVREAWKKNIKVVPIPGASAVITALSASPLPTDKFWFLGFLPKSETKKGLFLLNVKQILESMNKESLSSTIVFFESPHRLLETLQEMKNTFGNINIVIARELTKMYEEFMYESIDNIMTRYQKTEPKGEFVILMNVKEERN